MTEIATSLKNDHRAAYQSERPARWSMEDNQAMSVVMTFLDIVSARIGLPRDRAEVRRLDDYWFDVYTPDQVEWVKGCPDYFGLIFSGNIRFLFFELKIKKDGEFRLTRTGGKTKSGTSVAKYGCTSFYLDIVPVLRNMNDFCDKAGLPKDKFQVLFAEPGAGAAGINLISLEAINQMIAEGWNGLPIQKYGEGYGQETYLIPKGAMTSLDKLTAAQIMAIASERSILPDVMNTSAETSGPVISGFDSSWTLDFLLTGQPAKLTIAARLARARLRGRSPQEILSVPDIARAGTTTSDIEAADVFIKKQGWALSAKLT